VVLPAGASLRIRRVTAGTRVYVAVRGGVSVDGVSVDGVSVDGVSVDGEHLHIGADPGTAASVVAAARRELTGTVRVWPGPRVDWFADGSFEQLCRAIWSVTTTSRVGVRLVGSPLARRREGELPSEGIVEGAVQVPPDGQPIVMLADHPTTGGYPVIAVVDPKDLAEAAQAAPGTTLRFTRV
jgi:allophanate hydrolase subunit 2